MTSNQVAYLQNQVNARNVDENIRTHKANEALTRQDLAQKNDELQHRKAIDWVTAVFGR